MAKRTFPMKIWGLLLFLLLVLLILLPALFEYHSTKTDLMRLWGDQSRLVAETIVHGSLNMFRYDQEVFAERRDRLHQDGLTIRQLDSSDYPNKKRVLQFARERIGGRLLFLQADGRLIWPQRNRRPHNMRMELQQHFLRLIRSMPDDSTILIIDPAHCPPGVPPGILIRRAQNRGFIFIIYRPSFSDKMFRFHRLHRWLAGLGRSPNIFYIQLERNQRIVARTGKMHLAPLPVDQQEAMQKFSWRIAEFHGKKVFDYTQKAPDGLIIRVGISAAPLEHLQANLIRRLLINSFLLILIGFVVLRFFISKQNVSFLEEKLHQVETSTSAILKNMGEGIIAVNEQGKIELINRWAREHLGLEEATPAPLHALPFETRVMNDIRHFQEFTDVAFPFGKRFLLLSGRTIEFKSAENQANHKHLFLIIVRDFTSQKELEAMQSRRSKLLAMGALASRVAHEIRNPLNGIAMLAQRLQKEFRPVENEQEYQQMTGAIRQETKRINAIVQSFLLYAKAPKMHFETVSLKMFLQNLHPVLQAAGNNPLHLEIEEDVRVRIDRDQMKQVMLNLVKNAMEASTKEQPITIRIRRQDEQARIVVEDQGPGIPKELAERIFDLYFTTKNNGAGIGLSIVEKIVQSHGGTIRLESPYELNGKSMQGARFIIALPTDEQQESNV